MDLERAVEFILDQQAKMAVEQAKAAEAYARTEEQLERVTKLNAESHEQHKHEITEINRTLRRAIRLGVQEARAERKRRQELDKRTQQETAELRASQALTEQKLQSFIDSLRRGTNGGSHPQ